MRLSTPNFLSTCDFCGIKGDVTSLVASEITIPISNGKTNAAICCYCAKRALEITEEESDDHDETNPINKITMSIRKTFKQLLAKEPYKTFRKLEIIDDEDLLTDDGRDTFIDWLFSNKETAEKFYLEVAVPMMEEERKKK